MAAIISYSDHLHDQYAFRRDGMVGSVTVTVDKEPSDLTSFLAPRADCPFCGAELTPVHRGYKYTIVGVELHLHTEAQECLDCGWWMCMSNFSEEVDEWEEIRDVCDRRIWYGIARTFDSRLAEVPLAALLHELKARPGLLYDVHPTKFEELVQSVFSAFYSCRVEHVGRSGDGGIDLHIVESDEPILVQVKRRSSPRHAESVSVIRDFIGAMVLRDARKGIVVSTAKQYSSQAAEAAEHMLQHKKFDRFELIAFDRFCEMLNVAQAKAERPWQPLLRGVGDTSC